MSSTTQASSTCCECEHELHFDHLPEESRPGDPHCYGTAPATTQVKTIYGTFKCCEACVEHLQKFRV